MKKDELNTNHITAEEGKVLRRIADNLIVGKEIYLGYSHHLNGERVKPFLEKMEDYEEIDEPITEDTIILDEEKVLETPETLEEIESLPEIVPLRRITIADYLELESIVKKLTEKIGIE